jgi:hypothetical protein
VVTKAVFDNPVYRVLADLVGRKQLLTAGQTPEQVVAAYAISVKDAADQLGLTESSVRTAITNRKLSAMKRNGDWYIRPESIASYKVSNRGRKKAAPVARSPTEHSPPTDGVTVICGNKPGGSLSVLIANGELDIVGRNGDEVIAHFPPGWARAAVKMTTSRGVRVFELEPAGEATDAELRVEHLGFLVAGEFKIVKKHNSTKAANAAWKGYTTGIATELEANESYSAGREAGERWARHDAQPSHLRRLEEKYDHKTLTGVPDAYGRAGVLYSLLTGDQHGDLVEIRSFWKGALGEGSVEKIEGITFAEGFVAGALEVSRSRAAESVTQSTSARPVVS